MMARLIPTVFGALLLITSAATAGERTVTLDLRAAPLPAALTRIQNASGLHLAFAADLVKDAEPVTLSAKDEPVDSVLRRILRPRGMEFIYTAESMAAIVRADSDAGMAKAAGRALRTFARLARKLEGAVQEGDEVRVPGWTEGDDRALAEGIAELSSAKSRTARRMLSQAILGARAADADNRLALLQCFDAAVRIGGAACTGIDAEHEPQLRDSLAKMSRDTDELVRAAAVLSSLTGGLSMQAAFQQEMRRRVALGEPDALLRGWFFWSSKTWARAPGGLEQRLRDAAADAAPEVRLAAAIALMPPYCRFAGEILAKLRSDPCAAVRAAAWLGPPNCMVQSCSPKPIPKQLADLRPGLRDANPIVRAVVVDHMVRLLQDDRDTSLVVYKAERFPAHFGGLLEADRERLWSVLRGEGADKDPWTTLVAEAFLARRACIWHARLHWKSRVSGDAFVLPPQFAQQRASAAATIAGMMASGKPSHEMLASAALAGWASAAMRPGEGPALRPVAGQVRSPLLLIRLTAIVTCGTLDRADAEPVLMNALSSADWLERQVGLWGCSMLETASGSPALEKALRPLLESRLPAEEEFAARAVACTVPIDRATAILQDRCLARPASPSTAALLDWLLECRPSIIFDPGDNRQNELMLFDAVLESHSAPLQCRFINYLRRRQMTALDSSALFLTYITETEPDAFYALLGSYASFMDYSKFPGTPKWFAIDAALERLAGLIRPADGKPNLPALAALSDFLRHMRNSNVINERREKIFAMITPFLSTCFRPNAPDGEIEMGGEMVEFLLGEAMTERSGAGLTWKDLPPAVQAACCMWLSYANHEAHGHKVAALLSSCYERPGPWGSHSIKPPENPTAPELLKAMENARAAIMEKGGPHDQLLLLYGLAQCPDEAPAKEAMSELERRLLAGTIPTELAGNASATLYGGGTMQWDELPYAALRTWLARWKGPLSPELVRHLLDRISEPADRPRGALGPVRLLAGQPGMAEPLLAALQQVAKDRPDLLSDAVEAADVLRTEIEQARNEGRPDPPWTRAAGDLALQMAAAADFYHAREQAMPLYRVALGPKAAQTIEAMVLDEHIDPGLRAAAASQLFDAKSDTKILPAFTAKYERLPVDLRDALGSAVARTAEAEGGAEFLELFLADKQMPTDRRRIAVFRLRLQPTPRLRALLDKLANDPDLGNAIAQAIKRLDAEAAKRNGKPQENPQ